MRKLNANVARYTLREEGKKAKIKTNCRVTGEGSGVNVLSSALLKAGIIPSKSMKGGG